VEKFAFTRDGHRLLPSASDIGFWARFADASAIGSCMKDDKEKMTGRQDWDTRLAANGANGTQT